MTPLPTHFSADDLDAFHSGALNRDSQLHLETCDACRQLVVSDRFVLDALGRLARYQPRTGFSDLVMTRITVGQPAAVPVLSYPRFTRRRIAALVALAAGIVLSVAWSATNRSLLDGWLTGTGAAFFASGRASVEFLLRGVAQQSWYQTIREIALSPVRVALVAGATVALYGSGLMALRRLITPSGGPVSNAGI